MAEALPRNLPHRVVIGSVADPATAMLPRQRRKNWAAPMVYPITRVSNVMARR
jgi:hypothetical protein